MWSSNESNQSNLLIDGTRLLPIMNDVMKSKVKIKSCGAEYTHIKKHHLSSLFDAHEFELGFKRFEPVFSDQTF